MGRGAGGPGGRGAGGPGELQYPHEATWLESGNVMIFDNGTVERAYSRIVEVDPTTGNIVWEFRTTPAELFFSKARGTCQELPGGNVLIASSNEGEVFGVTRKGEVVWRYVPRDDKGKRLVIRAERYPSRIVEPRLRRDARGAPSQRRSRTPPSTPR